jgi:hypothetical protein
MKTTAVEFAVEQLEQLIPSGHQLAIRIILEQAKEMEKQQQGYSEEDMTEAFRVGFNLGCNAVESLTNEIAEEWFKNGLKKFKNK